jgi:hypothetical protein
MAFEIGWLESARKELVSREVVVNSCAFSKMLQKNVKGGMLMFLSVAMAYSCNMLIQIQYFAKKNVYTAENQNRYV